MRKIDFLLLFMFLVFTKSYSQVEARGLKRIETGGIQSNSLNISPNKDFEERIKIKPIEESSNDVEIRLYAHSMLTHTRDLKIIKRNQRTWKGLLFRETNHPTIKIRKYKLKAKAGFEELFNMLNENYLTKLPDQQELKPKMKKVSIQNG